MWQGNIIEGLGMLVTAKSSLRNETFQASEMRMGVHIIEKTKLVFGS